MMFKCDQCGICCRSLNRSALYRDLDNGHGICKYLQGNLCSIYDQRPLLCRVDDCYDVFFQTTMTREEYEQMNDAVCQQLKHEKRSD